MAKKKPKYIYISMSKQEVMTARSSCKDLEQKIDHKYGKCLERNWDHEMPGYFWEQFKRCCLEVRLRSFRPC